MKTSRLSALFGVALLATTAFAAEKASVRLDHPLLVNGKELAAGKYTVTWDGSGPTVNVTIARGNDVVVKTAARLVDLPKAASLSLVVTKDNPNGTSSLSEIQFQGKKYALGIGEGDNTETAKK